MNRPHLSKSVDELEQLFALADNDNVILQELAEELTFRRTSRAKELEGEIRHVLQRTTPPTSQIPDEKARVAPPAFPGPHASPGPATISVSMPTPVPPLALNPTDALRRFSNRTTGMVDAWSALEVLSPQTFRKPRDLAGTGGHIVSIEDGKLPWDDGPAKSRPKQKIYFHVVLGSIEAERAFGALLAKYQDGRDERPSVQGEVVVASVLVDKNGVLAGEMPVCVSAFAWGLPVALRGSLTDLAAWTQHEAGLVDKLTKQLRADETNPNAPVDWQSLKNAYASLTQALGIPAELLQGPRFAVAAYMPFRMHAAPDPLLLNSFYLTDLALAKARAESGALPAALSRYLGEKAVLDRQDLLNDAVALEESLDPRGVPCGRWPTNPAHRPALLQQAAVNLASRMSQKAEVLGINGPPGTGKSTLLRDIVADQITRRAEAMCTFPEPAKAFSVGLTQRKRGVTEELYTVDPRLKGFEMVLASSNNKAVENVSAEMPALDAIPSELDVRYFAPLAEELLDRPAWGLVAAVLGNQANRARFRRHFWTESTLSFKRYLERVAGLTPADSSTSDLADLTSAPTSPAEALARWQTAKAHFQGVSKQIRIRLGELEQLRLSLKALPRLKVAEKAASSALGQAVNAHQQAQHAVEAAKAETERSNGLLQQAELEVIHQQRLKPGLFFLKRLLGWTEAKAWESHHLALDSARARARHDQHQKQFTLTQASQRLAQAVLESERMEQALCAAKQELAQAQLRIDTVRVGPGAQVFDEAFLSLPHGEKQLAVPWLDMALQDLRQQLFVAAMEVHRTFIDAAALPILRNLNALLNVNFNVHPDRRKVVPDLWSTLFLVVPVVSTTFASVSRMLRQLPDESLGWLLVDEAGQAVPQAAVGALLRTKRAVVVGDPQQVEPVVPLPQALTRAVMTQFDVDPDRFAAPDASVQTLADDASEHCARFTTISGTRTVGAPLLVHRRCSSPMFDVSNRIAYGNLMVQAKAPKPSAIRQCLGDSSWFDVRSTAQDKYSRAEGEKVLSLLRALRQQNVPPDIYVVTPFVAVQDGLRELIVEARDLGVWLEDPRAWVKQRVGTVHTVQGREAEAVILVLGAPMDAQSGARNWAGMTPNLLNVAVTRAKEVVYVVGNRQLWAGAGIFSVLDDVL